MKKISVWLQSAFYVFAGVNHFINPDFYLDLIPPFLSNPSLINLLAGVFEIALGIGILAPKFRKMAVYGIMLMLIAFIPSHIYFIQIGSCIDGGLCVPEWIGWLRLIIIHPLLIYWAWTAK